MTIVLEQHPSEESIMAERKQPGREGRGMTDAALEKALKMLERQRDLNNEPGSWADDPDFARQVLDFEDV